MRDRKLAFRDRAELARTKLSEYVRQAWHVVEPATPYHHNWHIDAICEHLEAVSRGEIKNLLINMPPRHLKSLLVSVFWPTWEWINNPALRWIFNSYAQNLSTRDSLKCRRIIESSWYQERWGAVYQLTSDQNVKNRFENNRTGVRLATSVDGIATGEGGDRLVVDDPHNVHEAASDTIRKSVITWWDETMSTRLNDPKTGARVIVMQRVHEKDLSGHVLTKGNWEHLCLPAEYEKRYIDGPDNTKVEAPKHVTSIGWSDPRNQVGELLHTDRFGPKEIAALKVDLGSYATAGQLQQRPAPLEGGVIKRGWFKRFDMTQRPPSFEMMILSGDPAFKDYETSSNVALHIWGRIGPNKYLLDRIFGHMGITVTIDNIKALLERWHQPGMGLYIDATLIEDKANGPAIIEVLSKTVSGLLPVEPRGSKVARALAVSPQIEAGNVWIPREPWGDEVISAFALVPNGENWDDVDAASQALDYFARYDEPMKIMTFGELESANARA